MAFDARREDYQRLGLRFARTLTGSQADNVRAFAAFDRRFATDLDSLPQNDEDRAFHLVAQATTLVDYELPFATDEEAETIVARAHNLLDEALALDGRCHDALRMRHAAEAPSFEDHYVFLCEREGEVRAACEEARTKARHDDSPERAELGALLATLPYLRWVAELAEKALVCGRNREALAHAGKACEIDPLDIADLRFTAAYAHAKLEDDHGLEELAAHVRHQGRHATDDPWMRLATACLAHRRRDFSGARDQLRALVRSHPHAAVTLARQQELPDGVFARLAVPAYSEDELIVAVSEGAVLLREGRDFLGMGVFGSWVMREALALVTKEQAAEVQDLVELYDGIGAS